MTGRAPAKINLLLRVHPPDGSGFHDLTTLFCALDLGDEVAVTVDPGRGIRLDAGDADLGAPERNLTVRAARAFLTRAGLERSVGVRLAKRIPVGGGLGGGSSDAAAVLRQLDERLPGCVCAQDLDAIARELGSDVAFFLRGGPLAWGTGRGDVLTRVEPLPPRPVVLLIPEFPIGTAAAYGWLDDGRSAGIDPPAPLPGPLPPAPGRWGDVAALARNDFEGPVFRKHPELRALRSLLEDVGAEIALLAGSGSTVFGIFEHDDQATAAERLVRARATGVRIARTRTASN